MSLRSKVVGTLLGVFVLYVLAAWLVLTLIHTPAYQSLETQKATDQLRRVNEFITSEGSDVDLLVMDWAEWDDMFWFALGENDEFYDDNLAGGYLGELGMDFVLIVDTAHRPVWASAYAVDRSSMPFEKVFPAGMVKYNSLFNPDEPDEITSGIVKTALGPAIISSTAIFRSDGTGPSGGHLLVGKLLDANRMQLISDALFSTIDLIPVDSTLEATEFQQVLNDLKTRKTLYSVVKQDEHVYALELLRDINDQPVALLRVQNEADISRLGTHTLRTTISLLVIAALLFTLTLWYVLKRLMLVPIEHMTTIFRGVGDTETTVASAQNPLNTVKRLADSRGSISHRNDEIGDLLSAFDELSNSLQDATRSVWRIAHTDELTGLANRRVVMELFASAAESAADHDIAVLFIDLDNFKTVNDRLGHEAGDQLLIEVASRISLAVAWGGGAVDDQDVETHTTIARIGGDEFVVMIYPERHQESTEELASRIVAEVSAPYFICQTDCVIGASVGIAIFPEDANTIDELLAKADQAMYRAKQNGKNTWRRYDPTAVFVNPDDT
ncbi:MAG: diguanylate cyclase [Granulosicoccus sp.]